MQTKEQPDKNQRRCIATGEIRAKATMLRFVEGPVKVLVPDIKGKLPGRGVWITTNRLLIREAVKRKLFERNLSPGIRIEPEIDQQVDILLKNAAFGCLKMANKAGNAIYGFTKLMAALEKQVIIYMIHAREASQPESNKLDHKFRTNLEHSDKLQQTLSKKPYLGFDSEELSLAFGAANVIHAGLTESGASRAAITAIERVKHYRLENDAETSGS